jgi:hypothetical protein
LVQAKAVDLTRDLCHVTVHASGYRNEVAARLQDYNAFLRRREQSDAACDADAESAELTRELYPFHFDKYRDEFVARLHSRRLHPDQYCDDLARRLQIYGVSIFEFGLFEAVRDVDAGAVKLTRGPYTLILASTAMTFPHSFNIMAPHSANVDLVRLLVDAEAKVVGPTRGSYRLNEGA